jgi:hypothetical protein
VKEQTSFQYADCIDSNDYRTVSRMAEDNVILHNIITMQLKH